MSNCAFAFLGKSVLIYVQRYIIPRLTINTAPLATSLLRTKLSLVQSDTENITIRLILPLPKRIFSRKVIRTANLTTIEL